MEYSSSWGSYPSIFALGHRAIKDLLQSEVNVEEKIDGSQFSFGLVEASPADIVYRIFKDGPFALKIRSKGCVMHVDAPEKMFNLAAETVRNLADLLIPGWTYRGEFLGRPKHNALAYDRVPKGNVILFDVNTGNQEYLTYEGKVVEADRLGLEVVPRLFTGRINSAEDVRRFLESTSVLGGQKIEGVVIKPVGYDLFGLDKKCLFGKFVSEAFKEVHRANWKAENPTQTDVIGLITAMYTTPARWQKSVQHLRERGLLQDDPRDIGMLIKEVQEDVFKECADEIKEALFKHGWGHIRRGLTRGMPEWYKEQLLKKSFEVESSPEQGSTGSVDAESSDSRVSDLVSES